MDSAIKLSFFLSFFLLIVICSCESGLSSKFGKIQRVSNTGKKLQGEKIKIDPSKVTQLSWKPRAFLYEGFLSDEECNHLISLGQNRVKRSTVVGTSADSGVLSDVRTSSGTFIPRRLDPVIKRIEQRISAWTFLPEENGEDIQILRYRLGEKYGLHKDALNKDKENDDSGYRVATVLMYLSDVAQGGETAFPYAVYNQFKDDSWSNCSLDGLAVKPVKGNALLFFSLHLNGSLDMAAMHMGCPVVEGTKWSATKWIHQRRFGQTTFRDPTLCVDENPKCADWAAMGECVRNPTYMVRKDLFPGYCRKSCNACATVETEIKLALAS